MVSTQYFFELLLSIYTGIESHGLFIIYLDFSLSYILFQSVATIYELFENFDFLISVTFANILIQLSIK